MTTGNTKSIKRTSANKSKKIITFSKPKSRKTNSANSKKEPKI